MTDFPAIAEQYMSGVLDGSILVCDLVRKAVQRHKRDLENGAARGLRFDPKAGARVCRFISALQPSKWPTKIILQPWQVCMLMILYGWKLENGLRRFRDAYVDLPRKTGKSALGSALALYHLVADDERGAEVYSAALTEDQARRVFDEAVEMRTGTRSLRASLVKQGDQPCRALRYPNKSGVMKPLSRDKDPVQGTNPSFSVGDELHVWKTRDMYDAIKYGMSARNQPLWLGITTAPPAEDQTSFCSTQYNHAVSIAEGLYEDDSFFFWITQLDPEDAWDDEAVWPKACPNLGVTVKWDAMRQLALNAKQQPGSLDSFKRYSLNLRVGAADAAIKVENWDKCKRTGDAIELRAAAIKRLTKRICFAGLDLALTDDTSSLVLVFPPLKAGEKWEILPHFWIPEANITTRSERDKVPYKLWKDQGFLYTTPGEVTDHQFIVDRFLELSGMFDVRELVYDPALATGFIKLVLTSGFKKDKVVKFAQTAMNYAAPCGDFTRAISRQEIEHDADPVLRWHIGNLRWARNHTGLIMPDKLKSIEKIDGAVATIMGYGRANHPDNAKLLNKPMAGRL
jgi:phage terminase large subunit-like protein